MVLAAHPLCVPAAPISFSKLHSVIPHSFHGTMLAIKVVINNYACTLARLVPLHSFVTFSFQQASVHSLPMMLCSLYYFVSFNYNHSKFITAFLYSFEELPWEARGRLLLKGITILNPVPPVF